MNATTITDTIRKLAEDGRIVKCGACGRWIVPNTSCDVCRRDEKRREQKIREIAARAQR